MKVIPMLIVGVPAFALLSIVLAAAYDSGKSAANAAKVRSDLQQLAVAVESYYVDNMRYPFSARLSEPSYLMRDSPGFQSIQSAIGPTINEECRSGSWSREITTFGMRGPGQQFITITTPIPYAKEYPIDPYGDDPKATYGFSRTLNSWVMFSRGPSGWPSGAPTDYLLDPELPAHDQLLPWAQYREMLPSETAARTYDPTNGMNSSGWIWQRKR